MKTKCKYNRWISFSWGSWKYECNRSRAKLTWCPNFASDPLRSYFHEPQKNETVSGRVDENIGLEGKVFNSRRATECYCCIKTVCQQYWENWNELSIFVHFLVWDNSHLWLPVMEVTHASSTKNAFSCLLMHEKCCFLPFNIKWEYVNLERNDDQLTLKIKFILFMYFCYCRNIRTSSPKGNDRSPEYNVQGQILFKKSGDTDVLDAQGQLTLWSVVWSGGNSNSSKL